jgi:hypothetical protein
MSITLLKLELDIRLEMYASASFLSHSKLPVQIKYLEPLFIILDTAYFKASIYNTESVVRSLLWYQMVI